MRKPTLTSLFCACLLTAAASVSAGGWFMVYNFKGSVGKYPITLSFQMLKVDSTCKTTLGAPCHNLTGLYKYDKVNEMIPLRGDLIWKTGQVVLEEMKPGASLGSKARQDSVQARFEFKFNKGSTQGTWKSLKGPRAYPLRLEFVSSLIDTFNTFRDSTEKSDGVVDIPMSVTTADQYFIGAYDYDYLKYQERGAVLTSIKVLDKKSNRLIQRIEMPLEGHASLGANVTAIYENVGTEKDVLWVSFGTGGRGDGVLEYRWNKRKSRYVMMPEE